jgi:vacuolar-type H+-ATPase catalytic subunit A/Vma1
MPCHTDPPSTREYALADEVKEQLNELNAKATHGADILREYLLGNVAAEKILPLLNQNLKHEFEKLEAINSKNFVRADSPVVDQVRELIKRYEELNEMVTITGREAVSKQTIKRIEKEQYQHRADDLRRLRKVFVDLDDTAKLRKTLDATPAEPLHAQLGFDPDEF